MNNSEGIKKIFIRIKTPCILFVTVLITCVAFVFTPQLYKNVINKSNVEIKGDLTGIRMTSNIPVWFKYDNDTLSTNRSLDEADLLTLRLLVSDTCAKYDEYIRCIDHLAYKSNNDTTNIKDLIWLTLCLAILGASARTLYDYIGCKCYTEEGQNMDKWWPWYIFRPIICCPIGALLMVSVRTSLFSNLFVSRDLNTYLVLSFLAGFAIMEFLTMLRRVSKSIFEAKDSTANNKSS